MNKEQENKLLQVMIDMLTQNDKNFSFNLSLQGNVVEDLNDNFNLILTDHTSNKYKACALGISVVVGEIKEADNFAVFGVRTGDKSFMLDLVDLQKNSVYDMCIVDDFVGIFSCKRCVEIDEIEKITSQKLNYQLRKISQKSNKGMDCDCISRFENKVKDFRSYQTEFFRKFLLDALSSDQYMKDASNHMTQTLRSIEIKVYVNTIYKYFLKNPNLNIAEYSKDKRFIKEFKKAKNKSLLKVYQTFSNYPSEIYSVYNAIKATYKDNCVFGEYEDMTSILM